MDRRQKPNAHAIQAQAGPVASDGKSQKDKDASFLHNLTRGDITALRLKNNHGSYISSCYKLASGGVIYALPRPTSSSSSSSSDKDRKSSTYGICLYHSKGSDQHGLVEVKYVPLLAREQMLHYDSTSLPTDMSHACESATDGNTTGITNIRGAREDVEVLQCISWSPSSVLGGSLLALQTNRGIFVYYVNIQER
jgi:hypothetical protein